MSRYLRVHLSAETDAYDSFPDPAKHRSEVAAFAIDEDVVGWNIDAVAGGTAVTMVNFTTVRAMLIENLGTTATTTVSCAFATAAGATTVVLPIPGEGVPFVLVPDVNPATALTITASAGTIPCRVTIAGT